MNMRRITLYRTKNSKPCGIPMNRAVSEALIALEPDQANRHGWLFTRRTGAAWGQIRTAFKTALARAGIKAFRFHDLRHTAASHLLMRGATLPEVKEILGHSDIRMTMRYAHLGPAHLRGAVDRLDGLTPAPTEPAWSHEWDHDGTIAVNRVVSARAPVAQSDRARVS